MGYKLLGFIVWHAGKWWARRKLADNTGKLAVATVAIAVIAGSIAVGRSTGDSE